MSRRHPRVVLADSSFLMAPMDFRINIIAELDRVLERGYELVVPSFCVDELKRLEARGGKIGMKARLALRLVEKHCRVLPAKLNEGEDVDDGIVRLARELSAIVATGDKELRRRLRELGIPSVYVRAGKRLELEGELD